MLFFLPSRAKLNGKIKHVGNEKPYLNLPIFFYGKRKRQMTKRIKSDGYFVALGAHNC